MKFTTIPENGSSWRGKLVYAIDCESEVGQDIEVVVADGTLGLRASFNLYNVTTAEFDIAPYLRRMVSEQPTANVESLAWSSAAMLVVVSVGGVSSQSRLYYREAIDATAAQVLSTLSERVAMAQNETLRLSLFALRTAEVRVTTYLPMERTKIFTLRTYGRTVEFTLPLGAYSVGSTIRIEFVCDDVRLKVLSINIVKREASARQLVWYNERGGVEFYTFPRSVRRYYRAKEGAGAQGEQLLQSRCVVRRLLSAYEGAEEMERIAEMIFAPALYLAKEGECERLEIGERVVEFDDEGGIKQLRLDIYEPWRGGGLCS
ncbi:MAG: hypothetical protein J6Q33_02800 [Alistipes sp.]|nr:hypothetical protein [Alistipes sp.]